MNRYKSWYAGLWISRIGIEAAELNAVTNLWRLRNLIALALFMASIVVGRIAHLVALIVICGVVFLIFALFCNAREKRQRDLTQQAAARFLPFDCEPKTIPVNDPAGFDKWFARMTRSEAPKPPNRPAT